MLKSLSIQDYPHDKIYIVIADGKSKDNTVEIVRKTLENSDFMDYKIISIDCSIPEGRNICVENMRGDFLFFWDSDVIMEQDGLTRSVEAYFQETIDIISADGIPIFVDDIDELDTMINSTRSSYDFVSGNTTYVTNYVLMGHTLISRRVLDVVKFDPDLTYDEDVYFCIIAREKGFKIAVDKRIRAYDINIRKKEHSDIYVDMPLRRAIKGLRKKAKAHVLMNGFDINLKMVISFFLINKRYAVYLGYLPMLVFTIYGLYMKNYLALFFPFYILAFFTWQILRRGMNRGLKALIRSIIIGVPFSLSLLYYFIFYYLKK
jgi:glycosyltransferase involved in cell wall biosynthesis